MTNKDEKEETIKLSPEDEKLLEETGEVIMENAFIKALEELSEEDAKKINQLFETGNEEDAINFLEEKVPNFPKIVEAEIAKYREEITEKLEK